MLETVILCCRIYGEKSIFSVKIRRDQLVDELKKAIVAGKPHRFHGIDADSLDLWKVENESRNKQELREMQLNDDNVLDSTWEIGDYFEGYPPKRSIHIIIRAPEPGKSNSDFTFFSVLTPLKHALLLIVLVKAPPLVGKLDSDSFFYTVLC